jgi:hypothetical protein
MHINAARYENAKVITIALGSSNASFPTAPSLSPPSQQSSKTVNACTDKSKGAEFHAKKCRNTEFNPFLMQNIFSIFSPAENFE